MKKIIFLSVLILTSAFYFSFQQETKIGLNIGDKAPEIKLPDTSGKFIALSSLKGKIVLIDFWASWCRPCRMENPNVIAAYNKFNKTKFKNGKGFEVYSISLDNNKQAWIGAIKKDGLIWHYNTNDLNGETAKLYSAIYIPTNYLVDAKGIILAKNLRGPALDAELEKYLK